jgi:hypothetical protein
MSCRVRINRSMGPPRRPVAVRRAACMHRMRRWPSAPSLLDRNWQSTDTLGLQQGLAHLVPTRAACRAPPPAGQGSGRLSAGWFDVCTQHQPREQCSKGNALLQSPSTTAKEFCRFSTCTLSQAATRSATAHSTATSSNAATSMRFTLRGRSVSLPVLRPGGWLP